MLNATSTSLQLALHVRTNSLLVRAPLFASLSCVRSANTLLYFLVKIKNAITWPVTIYHGAEHLVKVSQFFNLSWMKYEYN